MEGSVPEVDPLILRDRIIGSILGVFIGNALGVGVHWQYDLEKLEQDRGFVTDYLDPLPGTYHSGTPDAPGRGQLNAGQLDQQGVLAKLLLESLADRHELDQHDFLEKFEATILLDPTMDGTREGGRYGWTDKSICDIFKCRIMEGKPWSECAPPRSDTPDAVVRASLIGALYFRTPHELAVQVKSHAEFATLDSSVQAHSVAFASMVAATVQGVPLTKQMKEFLYQQPGRSLPFTSMMADRGLDPTYGVYSEPDSLLWFGSIAQGVAEFHHSIQPAHRGVLLYGQFCAFFASVPSAYYCTARFPDDFEQAVLCSVNGGGQNTMRTSMVGALVGARVGKDGIPERFLRGLDDYEELLAMAEGVADSALRRRPLEETDAWYWPSEMDLNFTIGESTPESHSMVGLEQIEDVTVQQSGLGPFFSPDSRTGVAFVVAASSCVVALLLIIGKRRYLSLKERRKYQALDGATDFF
mmetsp:Transcript_71956/g.108599  ORF Transcript_71956/g.108599 Transcript_71956/m.108599 type:complete len:470 (-) Transcript_71956:51-1460(-)